MVAQHGHLFISGPALYIYIYMQFLFHFMQIDPFKCYTLGRYGENVCFRKSLTVSVILRVHVPAGSSPHVCTDMKSQFLKPLEDVSLSRSASSTVLVPEGRIQQGQLF